MKNYYDLLEVSRTASKDTINKVFKMHMKANHPDLFQGEEKAKAEEKSKELTEAYNVLSDDALRAKYDEELNESSSESSQLQAIEEENAYLKKVIEQKSKVINILTQMYGDEEIQKIVDDLDFGDEQYSNTKYKDVNVSVNENGDINYSSNNQDNFTSHNAYAHREESYANMTDEELKEYKKNEKKTYINSLFRSYGPKALITFALLVSFATLVVITLNKLKELLF